MLDPGPGGGYASSADAAATLFAGAEELQAELCLPCGNKLGECPLWDGVRSRLCWLDIEGRRFWQLDPEALNGDGDQAVNSFELPARAGSFCMSEAGEYVFAFEDGFSFYEPESGARTRITADFEPGLRTRLNDGAVDRQGRFVVGGHVEKGGEPITGVYRLCADLSVERLLEGVRCSNSICFAADGAMFFTDTMREKPEIWRFPDYLASGMSSAPEVFARPAGKPDGAALDSEGGLWSAEFGAGRVVRYRPDGTVSTVVHVPVRYSGSLRMTINTQVGRALFFRCVHLYGESLYYYMLLSQVLH